MTQIRFGDYRFATIAKLTAIDRYASCDNDLGRRRFAFNNHLGKHVGTTEVVRISKEEPSAFRLLNAAISRDCAAGIFLRDYLDARITHGKLCQNRRASIGRAIIHADDLDVAQGLRRKRNEHLGKIRNRIVDGDDNRDGNSLARRRLVVNAERPAPERYSIVAHMPPPMARHHVLRIAPRLSVACKMVYVRLVAGNRDLPPDAIVADLHIPPWVKDLYPALADEIQGVLIAEPFGCLDCNRQQLIQQHRLAECRKIKEKHPCVNVLVPFHESMPASPLRIFRLIT